MKLYRS